jgi:hypothetical protein
MTQKPKPTAADWAWAQVEYQRGTTVRTIAKHLGVSHPAVVNKAKRHSWSKPERDEQIARRLPTTMAPREVVQQPSYREGLEVNHDGMSPIERIMDCIQEGMTLSRAAKTAGVTEVGLEKLRSDPQFELYVDAASGRYHLGLLKAVNAAVVRGDMQAVKFMMERHPELRDEYGRDPPQIDNTTLNVQFFKTKLSASREDLIAARVIDVDDVTEIEGEVLPALPRPSD